MKKVFFRFYEELNDFLPSERQKVQFSYEYILDTSVKDCIESLGVPHSEIDLILVNGQPVDFNYLMHEGDTVSVYPEFESFDITADTKVRDSSLREPKFVVDIQLGKLA
ncbi:MAG: twitching motility protein PilT, partial [Bacteroidota bacterium]|nr:twitching motility protein PilT [Bacteroidota bacterium]